MKIAIGSIFRNSESYIYRYLDQIMGLRVAAPQHDFELLLVEGDSTDGTRALLDCLFFDAVTTCAHGGPLFGRACFNGYRLTPTSSSTLRAT